MLIGITGKAGAGKDTIGDYLVQKYGFKKIALADPIKRLVKDVFALDDHTVYDRIAREQPLQRWPNWTVRKLLQFIGTELFRHNIDDAVWVKSLWYKIQDDKENNYVVTDIRFPNELAYFKENAKQGEFYCLKVVRTGCDGHVGIKTHPIKRFFYRIIRKDVRHASEAYDLSGDFEINNNDSIPYLYNTVDAIIKDINVGAVMKEMSTS